jgi:hypothetical protein
MSSWAMRGEVREGDTLIADDGFTCIDAGARLLVERPLYRTDLFVACRCGRHFIDGQLNEAGEYVGFTKVERIP